MINFRENVIDILGEWGYYANTLNCGQPALNAGHVQLKCFINNVCPFCKTSYKEDSLVFNTETFKEIEEYLPQQISGVLSSTPGLEGIHFKPRKVFRHNYINVWNSDLARVNVSNLNELYSNFEEYYQDIAIFNNDNNNVVPGALETRYKAEHDWAVIPSVFDNLFCDASHIAECGPQVSWVYENQSVPENRVTGNDIEYDYNEEYWNKYYEASIADQFVLIPKYNVQMPVQTQTYDGKSKGIHWKLQKRTPIFRGEDFFVRFYKKAKESVNSIISSGGNATVSFNSGYYRPLDYTFNDKVIVDPVTNFQVYANNAIRPPDKNEDSKEEDQPNIYDFYTQAYYIIEINAEYFIIIPSRGYPTFVHFFKGPNANGFVAKRLGKPFFAVSGYNLINAEYFDVIVRNHLGRLVIQFEGKGISGVPPWIIERSDWVREETNGDFPYIFEKPESLIIPRGYISLWGGNIRCGFIFGVLQYETSLVSFVYPPVDMGYSVLDSLKAFDSSDPEEVTFSADYFNGSPLWLPMNGSGSGSKTNHSLVFEAYSGPKLEQGSIGDSPTDFDDVPLFTQDAQCYKNYYEINGVALNADSLYQIGYFYYNKPIKEFSSSISYTITKEGEGGEDKEIKVNKPVKTSSIVIRKNVFFNNGQARYQGFNTYIGMGCGDHMFRPTDGLRAMSIGEPNARITRLTSKEVEGRGWYVANCKTPILTGLKLVAGSSPDPRWADGTTVSQGTNRDPQQGYSQYFLDATDHITSFTHSWTSSGLTSLEHSGTINFYLNRDMTTESMGYEINNITSELLALQDRTFYIEIWAGYRDRETMVDCDHSNYTRIPGLYKMFTGLCSGGLISYEYGKCIMTCKVEDYSVVLKGMKFFNSPWFDAMKDSVAVRDIMRMAGFRDQGVYDPASLIARLADNAISENPQLFHYHFDGRIFKFENFGLPSGYNRLEQPSLKFNDGDPFIDAINKISEYSAKIFYFDEWGIAHYEDYQDIVEQDFQGSLSLVPLYQFTINPEVIPGQLVFNKVERSFDVDSVFNHLKILTNTPDMHLLIKDRVKWETMENPNTSGFLGYQKTFYQVESMFGSQEAQLSAINKYSVRFKPIVNIKFETYGLPLRATDIVSLEGEILRVTKVDHHFDAQKNQWWMNVECQRFQAIDLSGIQL